MIYNIDFQQAIEQAFLEYGASVAQERSVPDVRDGLKIGLRQGLYSQYHSKLTHSHKFQKAQKSVAAAMSLCYVHGDAAMYDTFIRAAKPWAFRYPLEEAQGAYGSPAAPDDHSAARYVEMRSSELADYLFAGLKKNAVKEWYNNYDDTEQIPSVLCPIGFWPLINGCQGIAVSFSTSSPQYNLREVNAALEKLILNPDIDFNAIYCPPDFATGGIIVNAQETKESIKNGTGKACRIRAKLEYLSKDNCIKATELPFGVYTNTVIGQLAALTEEDENYGIARVIDHTKKTADIRIYLTKEANPAVVMRKLYADTSLESSFSINQIFLDQGRYPKVFGWKDACLAYIAHMEECKRRELKFDMDALIRRNHILDGLKIALANIDDVVHMIRRSDNPSMAKQALMVTYELTEEQAKAILDMKLQRLANLEAIKVNKEYESNAVEIEKLGNILGNKDELNKLLISALREVAAKFGDARRTQLMNLSEQVEEIEEEDVILSYTSDTIKVAKRNAKDIIKTTNLSTIVFVTNEGKLYKVPVANIIEVGSSRISTLIKDSSPIVFIGDLAQVKLNKFWLFATEQGMVKKSTIEEYNYSGRQGNKMMKLKEGDKIVNCGVFTSDNETMTVKRGNKVATINVGIVSTTSKAAMGNKIFKE